MPKIALITGITGQDGSYLAELLLGKEYTVHGIVRRASNFNTQRIDHILCDRHEDDVRLHLHYGDMLDASGLSQIVNAVAPDEVYNLAAQSHVRTSFDQPVYTSDVVATGTLRLLEAVRDYRDRRGSNVGFYQASSSEIFGNSPAPQSLDTSFRPVSPYACAKVAAFWHTVNYREAYGLHACNGVLFNHESPRRGETFVTRKITRAVTRIKCGLQDKLYLGNLSARRDWGFAGEYVVAMWKMLQQSKPEDFVIATGSCQSVQGFVATAFQSVGLDWKQYIRQDKRYLRPVEVNELRGACGRAYEVLDWRPEVWMLGVCKMMVDADMVLAQDEKLLKQARGAA